MTENISTGEAIEEVRVYDQNEFGENRSICMKKSEV